MSQKKAAEIIEFNASRETARTGGGELGENEKAGAFLAAARKAAGLTLKTVSDEIKVKIDHLEAIEASRPERLPATPYAVGFVKVYAGYLGLDAATVAVRFRQDIAAVAPAPLGAAQQTAALESHIGEGARLVSIFGIIAILIFAIWIGFQVADAKNKMSTSSPQVILIPAPQARSVSPAPSTRPADEPVGETEIASMPSEGEPVITEEPTAPTMEAPQTETVTADNETGQTDAPEVSTPVIVPPTLPPAASAATAPALEEPPSVLRAPSPQTPSVREEVVVAAQLTRSVAPKYPGRCDRGAAELETVTVIFDVTAAGRTANARVLSSSNACFEESAVRTVGRWRFTPKTVNGVQRSDIGKRATLNFRR